MRNENIKRTRTTASTRRRKISGAKRLAAKEKKMRTRKLAAMVFVFLACFVYLSYVIIDIKMLNGDEFEAKAITQLINGSAQGERTIIPMRGSIVDRNMQGLAISTKVFTIVLDPRMLVNDEKKIPVTVYDEKEKKDVAVMTKNPETGEEEPLTISVKEDSMNKLQQALEYSDERMAEIEALLQIVDTELDENGKVNRNIPAKDNHYEIIDRQVSAEKAAALELLAPAHVYAEADSKRNYVNGSYAASVVGFVRGDTILGLEKQYNDALTGTPGRSFRVYSSEGVVENQTIPAKDGGTVVTTIDLEMQKIGEEAAFKYGELYDAKNASVIVMNPKTGEIYCMATYPTFDLNNVTDLSAVTKSKYREEWRNLEDEELVKKMDTLWQNFNITNTFEPGSIFKPITVAAALEEGIISPEKTFTCPGEKTVAGVTIGCNDTHGTITLKEAVAKSCNVAMMDIADLMGRDLFYKYQ
ncbi:MAG: hypothetical protein LBU77_06455, partial [Clostridiales bacterium]|nr:hypothetical protein [Clostridiales bacterium]